MYETNLTLYDGMTGPTDLWDDGGVGVQDVHGPVEVWPL